MEIGERLRMRRLTLGLQQKVVAADAGIAITHLSEFERGKRGVSLEVLGRIAAVLGLRLEFAEASAEGVRESPAPYGLPPKPSSAAQRRILDATEDPKLLREIENHIKRYRLAQEALERRARRRRR
ncbi:MAG: helix-turn-helix domain-containing protein [Nitrospinota bacterium]